MHHHDHTIDEANLRKDREPDFFGSNNQVIMVAIGSDSRPDESVVRISNMCFVEKLLRDGTLDNTFAFLKFAGARTFKKLLL